MSLNLAPGPCRVVLCSFCHYCYYQYLLSTKHLIKAFPWSQVVFRNDCLMWQVLQLFQGRAKMYVFMCCVCVFKSLLVELFYHQNCFIGGREDCSRVPNLFLQISTDVCQLYEQIFQRNVLWNQCWGSFSTYSLLVCKSPFNEVGEGWLFMSHYEIGWRWSLSTHPTKISSLWLSLKSCSLYCSLSASISENILLTLSTHF